MLTDWFNYSSDVAPVSGSSQPQRPEPTAPPADYDTPSGDAHAYPPPPPVQPAPISSSAQTSDDANTCVICMDAPIDTLFEPCMHSKCCQSCGNGLQPRLCPICRTPIQQVKRIFRWISNTYSDIRISKCLCVNITRRWPVQARVAVTEFNEFPQQ